MQKGICLHPEMMEINVFYMDKMYGRQKEIFAIKRQLEVLTHIGHVSCIGCGFRFCLPMM